MYLKVFFKTLHTSIFIITLVCNVSCTMPQYMPISFDIKQGNRLNEYDIKKIRLGMTKLEISSNIGDPTLEGFLNPNTWYYIFYYRRGNRILEHQILTLKFDAHDILVTINKE
ncbi:small membrane protein A [Candidatus Blochmanniella pennsylvanica str. BPEN]|uniref:Small membrane protein A n=3 Tax=ant endosymbionts TaxID=84564 RepID=Q492C5_BLOPB|nr:small membrane protein A [Candidatus Blochmannia pennsylvanicus str. BPEN]AGC03821.1 small protein A [Candidatus Blochmannia chromaiodes str. 640]